MSRTIETGKYGERLAVFYLESWGFKILQCNWRFSYYEIDIIASFENTLHFIEVKTRTSTRFGFPEESVGNKKLKSLYRAADEYLSREAGWKNISFDILSICGAAGQEKVLFIEDISA